MAATMERAKLMAAVVAPNASPEGILHLLRGSITAARRAYPDVLHVEVQDSHGDLWKLATQDADWSPSDPSGLLHHSVESAELDQENGELRLNLDAGLELKVVPAAQEAEDDPPNWKLLTPQGVVLVFGPGGRWQFSRADEPSGMPLRHGADSEGLPVWSQAFALNSQMLTLSVWLSIISIVVAAVSLVFALR